MSKREISAIDLRLSDDNLSFGAGGRWWFVNISQKVSHDSHKDAGSNSTVVGNKC